jgi:hypothetical protein
VKDTQGRGGAETQAGTAEISLKVCLWVWEWSMKVLERGDKTDKNGRNRTVR